MLAVFGLALNPLVATAFTHVDGVEYLRNALVPFYPKLYVALLSPFKAPFAVPAPKVNTSKKRSFKTLSAGS
jgi:hypothetical protein